MSKLQDFMLKLQVAVDSIELIQFTLLNRNMLNMYTNILVGHVSSNLDRCFALVKLMLSLDYATSNPCLTHAELGRFNRQKLLTTIQAHIILVTQESFHRNKISERRWLCTVEIYMSINTSQMGPVAYLLYTIAHGEAFKRVW